MSTEEKVPGAARRRLKRSLRKMAAELLPGSDLELSVAIVGDAEMRRLNREYRGVDETTDVLSFPQITAEELDEGGRHRGAVLGDIVICMDAAARQASERGHSTSNEVELLSAHGFLHLLGYTHGDALEAGRMADAERKLIGGSIIGDETGDS
ncbi:MAG: rRNA maturation RNase YbeY [Candidatus Geothermincolia bacterium]